MQHHVIADSLRVLAASLTVAQRPIVRGVAALGVLGACAAALLVGAARADGLPAVGEALPAELAALHAACEAGEAVACNDLGVSFEHGYSVRPDSQRAAALFERACAYGVADSCSNLGALHERGDGVEACVDVAFELYQRACEQKSALGCSNLGALYARGVGRAVDRDEAQRLFSVACAGGSATGCENLETLVAR